MPSSASEKPQQPQGGSGMAVSTKSGGTGTGKTTQNPFGNEDFDDFPNSTANRRIHLASPDDERFKVTNFPRNTSASALMMPPTPTSVIGGGGEEGACGSGTVGWGLGLLARKGSTSNSRSVSPSKPNNDSVPTLGRRQSTTLVSYPPTMREETLAEIPSGRTNDDMEARRMESTIAFINPVPSANDSGNEILISDLTRLDTDTLLGGGGPSTTVANAQAGSSLDPLAETMIFAVRPNADHESNNVLRSPALSPPLNNKSFGSLPSSLASPSAASSSGGSVLTSSSGEGGKRMSSSNFRINHDNTHEGEADSDANRPSSLLDLANIADVFESSPQGLVTKTHVHAAGAGSGPVGSSISSAGGKSTRSIKKLLGINVSNAAAAASDTKKSRPVSPAPAATTPTLGTSQKRTDASFNGETKAVRSPLPLSPPLTSSSPSNPLTTARGGQEVDRGTSPANGGPSASPSLSPSSPQRFIDKVASVISLSPKPSPSAQMHSASPPPEPIQTNKAAAHTPAKNNSNAASVPTVEEDMPALDLPPASSSFLSSVNSPKKRASTTSAADTVGGREYEAANSSFLPPPSTPQKTAGPSTSFSSAAAELIKAKMTPQTKPMRRNSDEAKHGSPVGVERNIFGQKEMHGQSSPEVVGEEFVAPVEGGKGKGGLLPKLRPLSSPSLMSPSRSPQRPPPADVASRETNHSEIAAAAKTSTTTPQKSPATASHDPSPQGSTSASSLTTPSSTPSTASLAHPTNSHMLPSLTAFSLASPLESSSFNAMVSAPLIKGASLAGIHEQHQEAQREREEATRREKEELERILAEREAEEKARQEALAVEERRAKLGKLLAANNPDEAAMPPVTTPRGRSSDDDKEEAEIFGGKNKSMTTTVEEVILDGHKGILSPLFHHKKSDVIGESPNANNNKVSFHSSNNKVSDESGPLIRSLVDLTSDNGRDEPSGHGVSQNVEHQSKVENVGGEEKGEKDEGAASEEENGPSLSNKAQIKLGKASSLSDREEEDVGGQECESSTPPLLGAGGVDNGSARVETAVGGEGKTEDPPASAPVALDHDEHFAAAVDASVKGEPLPVNPRSISAPTASLESKASSSSATEGNADRGPEEEKGFIAKDVDSTTSGEGKTRGSANDARATSSSSGAAQSSSVSSSPPSSSSSGGLWTYAGSFYAGSSSSSFFSGNGLRDYLCGTLSGVGKVVAGYPFDTLKGRVQGGDYGGSVRRALRETWRREGLLAFYQGVMFPAANVCFVGGLLFYVNGAIRKYQQPDGIEPLTYGQMFWAGCGGGAAVGLWTVPIEVMKIRMQLLNKSEAAAAQKAWLARANASSSAATNFFRSSAEEKVFAAQAVRDAARPKVPPFKPTAQLIAEEAAWGAASSSTRTAGANFVSKLVARGASAASTGGVAANTGAAEGRATANLGKPIVTNARSIVASLRPIDFFAGFTPTMIRECGTFGLFFPLNEYFKRRIALRRDKIDLERLQRRQADQRKARLYGLAEGRLGYHDVVVPQPCFTTRVMAAGFAGMCCWLPVYPVDQIKTKMQLHPAGTYRTWLHCGAEIVRNEGIKTGLFKGLGPCLVRAFPAYAAQFLLFEKLTEAWKKSSKK